MSDKRVLGASMATTTAMARKPRAVLVGKAGTASISEQLRKLDWDVLSVPVGDNLACSVLARKPSVVVLPVGLDGESGYLIAAKLRTTKRKVRVVLVDAARTTQAEGFAEFIGASFVADTDGADALVNAVVA